LSKEVDARLRESLRRVYGSLLDNLLDLLYKPSKKLYVRVNTMYITRDELIERFRDKGLIVKPDPYVEEAVYFDIEGPFNVPILDKKIVVDKEGAESIMIGANLYAPGIVRYDEFSKGEEVTVIAPNGEPVAVVETTVSSEKLKNMDKGLVGINILSKYRAPPIRDLPEYSEGLFYPQSLPAMLTTRVLNPRPHELILDMNSAPGGKTSHIVQLSHGLARIIAFERNVRKASMTAETLVRLRLFKNVMVLPMDSRYLDIDLNIIGKPDKILIDPPCTGLGVRPKIYIDKSYEEVLILSKYQIQFLKTASRVLKCNGLIVYSTCTITFEENELVTLKAIREYSLEPIDLGFLPYSEKIEYEDLIAYRFTPLYHDMPGYYIVALTKKC